MTATFYVGDAVRVMNTLPEKSVDLILTSPPFLALRSYLPQDHPDKALEGGSQATPGAYIDWLLDVVEACARVLAPHGSLCFELGDTYSGSAPMYDGRMTAAGTAYAERLGPGNSGGTGWPLAKSLSLIPETFRFAMVYGHNPHTGRKTEPWRLRNVIRWVRPNPPVGALGDKFRPATSELMVFCKAKDRFFDLDAVRTPHKEGSVTRYESPMTVTQSMVANPHMGDYNDSGREYNSGLNAAGAPPLDWWNVPLLEGEYESREEPTSAARPYRPGRKPIDDKNPSHGWGDRGQGFENPAGAPPLDWWNIPLLDGEEETAYGPKEKPHRMSSGGGSAISAGVPRGAKGDLQSNPNGAPPLDWWEITAGGFSGAHYAVWPPELLVTPIKAMCPEKVCRVCGEPSRRIVESERHLGPRVDGADRRRLDDAVEIGTAWLKNPTDASYMTHHGTTTRTELGFTDCGHDDYRPGLVLDPFAGSGTTLSVATGHGRDAIGIDLDERNYELSLDRVGPLILQRGEIPDGAAPKS